ncbi:MAG: cobalamin-dependent protein [bacterium]|nr:cobalamin-dependent protein [bacterium]
MRVLLISSNTSKSPFPVYPIGCSLISAALTCAGHETSIYDFLERKHSFDTLEKEIKNVNPGIIGISIRNIDNTNMLNEKYYIDDIKNIVKKIKNITNVPLVLGGAGFSLMPDIILKETGADYGIIGEGESLMADFVNDAGRGIFPGERIIRGNNKISGIEIPRAVYEPDLMNYYLSRKSIIPIQTKRGCNHRCVYCTYPFLEGTKIRPRDPDSVIDDIEMLAEKYKVKYISFNDAVFNDDGGLYLDLMEKMERRSVKISWFSFFKPKGLTKDIIELMKRTGLSAAEIGSDAVTNSTLKKLGKDFSFQNILDCNNLFSGSGIPVSHFVMFGGPGETKETVLEGIKNIKALKNSILFIFMGIRILPNTSLSSIAIDEKIIASNTELLKPVYYISPAIDKDWLKETLANAFSNNENYIFPPDEIQMAKVFFKSIEKNISH